MYFAKDSMQGMDMTTTSSTHTPTQAHIKTNSGLQNPALAFPLVSLTAIILMLGLYWLLKRFTSWQFPINKKGI